MLFVLCLFGCRWIGSRGLFLSLLEVVTCGFVKWISSLLLVI